MEKKLKEIIKRESNKNKKLEKIEKELNKEMWKYTSFTSKNGYVILEVFESFFIVETEKTFRVVKIWITILSKPRKRSCGMATTTDETADTQAKLEL